MSKNSYIFLNTDNGIGLNYDSNFNLNLSKSDFMANSISLMNVCFNNSVYPFSSFNNTLTILEAANTLNLTITPNNYTGNEMAAHLQTLLNAATLAAFVYTVSYNTQSKKLTISSTGTFTITGGSSLNELGFVIYSSPVSLYNGNFPVNLAGSKYIDVISSLSTNNISSNKYSNVLARIPLDGSFGSIISWENEESYIDLMSDISNITLRLFDESGRPYRLPNNVSVSYTFKLRWS